MSSAFKNDESLVKENCVTVSILFHISKVFEGIFYKEINSFMTIKFSHFLWGFRKNHYLEYSLLKVTEIWEKHLNKGNRIGVIWMELSKPIKTINYSLLLTRLEAYGFSTDFLILIPNYLILKQNSSKASSSFYFGSFAIQLCWWQYSVRYQ